MVGSTFFIAVALPLVWLALVFLTWLVCRRISPNFLGKRDPEAIFVYAVLLGALVYAVASSV
jgi:hypothetical protein